MPPWTCKAFLISRQPMWRIFSPRKLHMGHLYVTRGHMANQISSNMGLTATLAYMLLWNWDDLKYAWAWAHPNNIRRLLSTENLFFWRNQETPEERLLRKENDPNLDPHYKLMLRNKYKEVPMWWWVAVLVICWVVGLACLYAMKVMPLPSVAHTELETEK